MSNYVTVRLSRDEAEMLYVLLNENVEQSAPASQALLNAGLEPSRAEYLGMEAWKAVCDALNE